MAQTLRFTLTDYTTNPSGDSIVVDEPQGWDGIRLTMAREYENHWHGFFDFVDDSFAQMQFDGIGADILRAAYESDGLSARVDLKVEFKCGDGSDFEELYFGKCVFDGYTEISGDMCYVSVGVERSSELVGLRNRYDQPVNLESRKSFDMMSDNLDEYQGLGIRIPSGVGVVEEFNKIIGKESHIEYTHNPPESLTTSDTYLLGLSFDWLSGGLETDEWNLNRGVWEFIMGMEPAGIQNGGMIELLNFSKPEDLSALHEMAIEINISGGLNSSGSDSYNWTPLLKFAVFRDGIGVYNVTLDTIGSSSAINSTSDAFSYSGTQNVILKHGDRVFVFLVIQIGYTTGAPTPSPVDIEYWLDAGSTIEATLVSTAESTPIKSYMINESLSRCAEAYTNNVLKVKSDYYGRKDSLPYQSEENGCGGNRCITNGALIRRAKGADMNTPTFRPSMKMIYDGLNAIDNIGMGVEPDTEIGGSAQWLRIEPLAYFYQQDTIFTANKVREIRKSMLRNEFVSKAVFGYQKYATERAAGRDDVFGVREYRTSINDVKSEYSRLSQFVASNYAIEVTRRVIGQGLTDWRYDDDPFVICLNGGGYTGTITFTAASGGDPATIDFELPELIDVLSVGDTLVVTGTVSNNGTYVVDDIYVGGSGTLIIIEVSEPVTNEGAIGATIHRSPVDFYFVEQGGIESSSDVRQPNYLRNIRITPARNAMRHFGRLQSVYYPNTGNLIFTNGTGNYQARIAFDDATECVQEPLALTGSYVIEDATLATDSFEDADDAATIFANSIVEFDFPLSYDEYKTILSNPYGLVEWSNENHSGEGWISKLEYSPYKGMAKFTLISKPA